MNFRPDGDDVVLRATFDELTALLVAEETLDTVLHRVVVLACSAVGPCDYASVTIMNDDGPESIVFTDPIADEIDQVQYAHETGPCLEAFRTRAIVSIPSMRDDDRWTPFRTAAMSHGVQSSFSLPLAAGTAEIGALNLYGREDHGFRAVAAEVALSFAAQAAAAVWNARTHEQTRELMRNLELALESRDVIGMAKGIIMANERVTPDEAFRILRVASQHRNVKLRDLAVEITATGVTPTP